MRRDMRLLCCTDYMLEHRERNRGRHHKTKKKTDMNSASLSKKITVYAIACMAVTALGLGLVFMSLMQADFDSFSNTVLIACAALIIGCGLGVYCLAPALLGPPARRFPTRPRGRPNGSADAFRDCTIGVVVTVFQAAF